MGSSRDTLDYEPMFVADKELDSISNICPLCGHKLRKRKGILFDVDSGIVLLDGKKYQIGVGKKILFFALLAENLGAVVTKDMVLRTLYINPNDVKLKTLDVMLLHLRDSIAESNYKIRTVRGRGFVLHEKSAKEVELDLSIRTSKYGYRQFMENLNSGGYHEKEISALLDSLDIKISSSVMASRGSLNCVGAIRDLYISHGSEHVQLVLELMCVYRTSKSTLFRKDVVWSISRVIRASPYVNKDILMELFLQLDIEEIWDRISSTFVDISSLKQTAIPYFVNELTGRLAEFVSKKKIV